MSGYPTYRISLWRLAARWSRALLWSRVPLGSLLPLLLGIGGMGLALPPDALETVRHLAIQHNGRVKPFDSFARETLRQITGLKRIGRADGVETVLSIALEPKRWQEESLIHIPFIPLREALGLHPKTERVSYHALIAARRFMPMLPAIVEKQSRNEKLSMLENETVDLYNRFAALNGLFQQDLYLVPPPSAGQRRWLPIVNPRGHPPAAQAALKSAWDQFTLSVREKNPPEMEAASSQLALALRSANPLLYPAPWRLRLEVIYNVLSPFRLAKFLYLVACLGLLFGLSPVPAAGQGSLPEGLRAGLEGRRAWAAKLSLGALLAGFLIHGAGILTRIVLAGRPPVSNFYETMLWLPFVAVALALIFERIHPVRAFGFAASLLGGITLWLADLLPLDPSLTPVVAVLRSNLWLTIHVLTIVASYGALALATVLAHLYGWLLLTQGNNARTDKPLGADQPMGADQQPGLVSLELFLYRSIQVGVVLLASGIMLGGVWANASWGRYWGWDPKETWALITLLWFLAILHGRFAGWLKGIGVALATIGGFFLLLVTYYGVSFYLVGLHSYAGEHAKPLPPLLIAYLLAEIAFMALVAFKGIARERTPA